MTSFLKQLGCWSSKSLTNTYSWSAGLFNTPIFSKYLPVRSNTSNLFLIYSKYFKSTFTPFSSLVFATSLNQETRLSEGIFWFYRISLTNSKVLGTTSGGCVSNCLQATIFTKGLFRNSWYGTICMEPEFCPKNPNSWETTIILLSDILHKKATFSAYSLSSRTSGDLLSAC